MGSWIQDGFLESCRVPGFTMGSCIHDGFLDSGCVPRTKHGTALHRNLWHFTDQARKYLARHDSPDPGTAWHGTYLYAVLMQDMQSMYILDTSPGEKRDTLNMNHSSWWHVTIRGPNYWTHICKMSLPNWRQCHGRQLGYPETIYCIFVRKKNICI